jgi:hypothetical protein
MEQRLDMGALTVLLDCDERLQEGGRAVLDKFAELNRHGPVLRDGSRVQFGWTILTLRSENGSLRVFEPDYMGDPLHDLNRNLDLTLEVIADQVAVLRRENCEGLDARFDQYVLAGPGAVEAADIFLTRRDPVSKEDSGWFLGDMTQIESGSKEEELQAVRVFELLRRRRAVSKVLALPPGYAVVMQGNAIDTILNDAG